MIRRSLTKQKQNFTLITTSQIVFRLSSNVLIVSNILQSSSLDDRFLNIENKRDNGQTKSATDVTCLSK